ncbi:MAG: hypothetical protein D3M94_22180 [Rhodocyclales bacterium GT-UBC]|nr:MAG: hypothetical protein D3M94_22180 [Rhodocyclales bacterium GT-UBC]
MPEMALHGPAVVAILTDEHLGTLQAPASWMPRGSGAARRLPLGIRDGRLISSLEGAQLAEGAATDSGGEHTTRRIDGRLAAIAVPAIVSPRFLAIVSRVTGARRGLTNCCRSIWLMELRPGWLVSTAAVSGARARS